MSGGTCTVVESNVVHFAFMNRNRLYKTFFALFVDKEFGGVFAHTQRRSAWFDGGIHVRQIGSTRLYFSFDESIAEIFISVAIYKKIIVVIDIGGGYGNFKIAVVGYSEFIPHRVVVIVKNVGIVLVCHDVLYPTGTTGGSSRAKSHVGLQLKGKNTVAPIIGQFYFHRFWLLWHPFFIFLFGGGFRSRCFLSCGFVLCLHIDRAEQYCTYNEKSY